LRTLHGKHSQLQQAEKMVRRRAIFLDSFNGGFAMVVAWKKTIWKIGIAKRYF
jgi:hypothetical protein